MATTKCLLSFKNKMAHFNTDLEFVSILKSLVENGHFSDSSELFPGSSNENYESISNYVVGDSNRKLVVNHLRATIYTAYIKDLYEEFSLYLKNILKEVYSNAKVTPERLTGENKVTFSSVQILRLMDSGTLVDAVIDGIFQSLENERSTIDLIKKFHTKIGIEQDSEKIDRAIYFLEIRHKLVHTDGQADAEFKENHSSLKYTPKNRIKLDYSVVSEAYQAVYDLVTDIDSKVLRAGLAKRHTE